MNLHDPIFKMKDWWYRTYFTYPISYPHGLFMNFLSKGYFSRTSYRTEYESLFVEYGDVVFGISPSSTGEDYQIRFDLFIYCIGH